MNTPRAIRWVDLTRQARALGLKSFVYISEQAWDEVVELWEDPEPGMEDEDARIRRLLLAVKERAARGDFEEPLGIAVRNPAGGVLTPLELHKWKNSRGDTCITINSR